ncbi:MAG: hypothetical protein KGL39_30560 [Patescibacteria group bacterium]|nr:hypothetical protein [Patescibacteria group bacterium]
MMKAMHNGYRWSEPERELDDFEARIVPVVLRRAAQSLAKEAAANRQASESVRDVTVIVEDRT